MKKTRLFIIRHAETIGNIEKRLTGRQYYPLTSRGKWTAHILAEELKDIHFEKAFASTSSRTVKTIEEVAKNSKIDIIELEELSEMYFGTYDGWKWEDVNKENPRIKKIQNEINIITGIENQETMEQVADRMYNCIYNICRQNIGKTLLIASHGVAIEAFLRKITKIPFWCEREKYCQYNTAINELEFEDYKFKIIKMADTNYISKYEKDKVL